MKARWTETALNELDDIFSYIYDRNRTAASAVVRRVESLVDLLETFPLAGHITDEAGVRMLAVVRYPFLIFYAIDQTNDEVVILHILHAAQDRPQTSEASARSPSASRPGGN